MPQLLRIRVPVLILALAAGSIAPAAAQTQYFGRNKVQYKPLKFEVLRTENFDIYFYPEERAAAVEIGRMAERWHARLSDILEYTLPAPQPIVLYASHADFQQTNVVEGAIGEGTGGVTEGLKRRIALPLAGTLADTDHVLGHELVHAFQYDMAGQGASDRAGSSLERLPLWFVEGMAEYLSIGHQDPHTAMWIRDASREDELPTIGDLNRARYFPYRWGQALWAYVAGRWGDDVVWQVFSDALDLGDPEKAFEEVVDLSADELSTQWHEAIRRQYGPILEAARPADAYGRRLSEKKSAAGALSVSPVLSPDGRRLAYLSERDLLSVDLFVADAETGEVIRKLVDTAADPHFTSLQFISSAGSWHPNGRQFAFGAVREGQAELAIVDVEGGDLVREIPFPALGEILNPSWSPDGRFLAFSATAGGHADLFIYDLEAGALRQITADSFADLQPAWSPDGRTIAFVTDRFSTDLATLDAGAYQLALLDPASGRIDAQPTFDRGKSINPQWAPDSRKLYFLSDRTGITNVYVIDVADGRINQVTDLAGGVSGITALSPALSVPMDANRLAFSAYEDGSVDIHLVDAADVLAGSPVTAAAATSRSGGILPPETRVSDELATLLADATTGLPAEAAEAEPYRPRLSLDFVGQPYLTAGLNPFGTAVGGGLSFLWSDMLGSHNLFAAVDANTYGTGFSDILKNTGGVVAYQNLAHRWNWGLAVEQSPYVSGGFLTGLTSANGQPALVEQTIIQRQIFRGVTGGVAYPFSQVRRVEFGGGYQQVAFEQQVRTVTSSLVSGRRLSDQTATASLGDALHLGTATAALVFDSSVFGATSPVAGERARFEMSPTVGSLSFVNALADYRRYFMPARFYTIAGRVLHAGRYGPDGEDARMLPLFLGYPELVRGYGIGSFTTSECTASATGSCQEFDRLLGSRMLVANLEFRFPLLRPFRDVSGGMYGPLPIEVGFFADAGVAWNGGERPSFFGGTRQGVASAGVTFRTNLGGFAIAQIDLAHPFQRQGRGWVWGFSLSPGF